MTKICKVCHKEKDINLFVLEPRNKSGRGAKCYECNRKIYKNLWHTKYKRKRTVEENRIHNIYERRTYYTLEGWAMAAYRGCKQRKKCSITKQDIIDLWHKQNGLCAITKQPMDLTGEPQAYNRPSVDRIDNSKGYLLNNIRLVWIFVNQAKNKFSDKQLYFCCQSVIKGMEEKK